MKAWKAEVIIRPVTLRFSYYRDEIFYHFASDPQAQVHLFDEWAGGQRRPGFLPVASTVLLRGPATVIVDPGNHHLGFYGLLGQALASRGLDFGDVDLVAATHCHHDHFYNVSLFPGRPLVVGGGELEFARELYGAPEIAARLSGLGQVREVGREAEILPGLRVLPAPGHTPGGLAFVVETGDGLVAITGDTAMTASEYLERRFSPACSAAQVEALNRSLDFVSGRGPEIIIPGHDRLFRAP